MSTEIDNRVVSIQFDNARFEKNVHQSIATLAALDESLQFQDSAKGIQNVSKEIEKLDMSSVQRGIDGVIHQFSALEIAAKTTIANITLKIENAVSRWTKSLTTDMMSSGYRKYDDQTAAMQTLVNATGKSIDELETKLDKLQWFSDETSYSFNEMMTALQTMASSGSDLDKSIDLMMGLANATAYAGQNAQSFVMASRNITQSYSMGYLNLQDWKSLELAKVNSKGLVETLIRAGEEAGTIKKGAVTVQNFRDSLKDKWATREVMEQGFGRFAEMSKMAYEMVQDETNGIETASEAYKILEEQYDDIYMKAAKAAQEAKTFREAIDATHDALSSSWSNTYKYIVGNYEEAKVLWTGLANLLYDAFVEPRNALNSVLKEWKDAGGRTDLIEAFVNIMTNLVNVIKAVKSGFREIFPKKTAKDLKDITGAINSFTSKAMIGTDTLIMIRNIVMSVSSVAKIGINIFKALFKAISPLGSVIGQVVKLLFTAIYVISSLIGKLAELISEANIISGVGEVISKILSVITGAINIIVFGITTLVSSLKNINFNFMYKVLDAMRVVISAIAVAIGGIVYGLTQVVRWFQNLWLMLKNSGFASSIGNGLLIVLRAIGAAFTTIVNGITVAYNAISKFILKLKDLTLSDKIKAIGEAFGKIKDRIGQLFEKTGLSNIFAPADEGGSAFVNTLRKVKDELKGLTERYTLGKIAALAFTFALVGVMASLGTLMRNTSGLVSNLTGTLKTVKNILTKTYAKSSGILNVGMAFGILAGSLYLLAQVKTEDLKGVVDIVSDLILLLGACIGLYAIMAKSKFDLSSRFKEISSLLLSLSAIGIAFLAMAGAFKVLESVRMDQSMYGKIVAVIVATFVALAGALVVINYAAPKAKNAIFIAITLVTFARAVKTLISGLALLADADYNKIEAALTAMVPIMFALGVLAFGIGNIRTGTAIGVIALMIALKAMIPAFVDLCNSLAGIPTDVLTMIGGILSAVAVTLVTGMIALMVTFAIAGDKIQAGLKGLNSFILVTGLMSLLVMAVSKNLLKDPNAFAGVIFGLVVFTILFYTMKNALLELVTAVGTFKTLKKKNANIDFSDIGKSIQKMFKGISSILIAVAVASAIIAKSMNTYGVWQVLGSMTLIGAIIFEVMMMLSVVAQSMTNVPANVKMFSILKGIMVALAVLVAEMIVLSVINPLDLIAPLVAISTLMGFLSMMIKSIAALATSITGKKAFIKTLVLTGTVIVALVGVAHVLKYLAKESNGLNLLHAAVSIGSLIVALTYVNVKMAESISKLSLAAIRKYAKVAGLMLAELLVSAVSIKLLATYNWKKLSSAVGAMTLLLTAFAAITTVIATISSSNIVKGGLVAAVASISVLMLVVAGSIRTVVDSLTKYTAVLKSYNDSISQMSSTTFKALPAEAYEAGKSMMVQFSEGIKDNLGELTIALSSITELVRTTLEKQDYHNVGKSYINSLAVGMASNGEAMQTASQVIENDAKVSGALTTLSYVDGAVRMSDQAYSGGVIVSNEFVKGLAGSKMSGVVGAQQGEEYSKNFSKSIQQGLDPSFKAASVFSFSSLFSKRNWVEDYKKEMTDGLKEAGKVTEVQATAINNMFRRKSPLELLADGAKKAYDSITEYAGIDPLKNLTNFDTSDILKDISSTYDDMKARFSDIGGKGDLSEQLGIDNLTDSLDNLDTGLEKTKSTFETLYDTISGQMDLFKEFDFTADISTDQMLKNMSDNILGVTEWSNDMAMLAARGVSQPLLEKLGSLGPQGFKYVKAFINMTDEELQEANNMWGMSLKLPSYAAEEVEASYKFAGEVAVKGFSDALDKYSAMLDAYSIGELTMEQIASALYDYNPKVVSQLKTNFEQLPTELEPPVEDAGDKVGKDYSDAVINAVKENFQKHVKDFQVPYSTPYDGRKAPYKRLMNAIVDAFGDRNGRLVSKEGSDMQRIFESWYETGSFAVEGVEAGFITNENDLYWELYKWAARLPEPVRKALEIESPSKVFYQIGEYMVEGLANAIEDDTSLATDATGNMAESIKDTMSGFSEEVNKYLNSEGDLNPVISPVLDLTNIQNGASTLDSLFSADKAIRATSVYDDNARMAAEIAAANRTDQLETVINACVNKVIEAMVANQPVVETNIYNDADPFGIFKAVRSETKKFTRANGYNPLI